MGNQQVYLQTGDLIDNIVFGTGTPSNWGQSFVSPPVFGLQWASYPSFYLTPFAPVRLLTPGSNLTTSQGTYTNFIMPQGAGLLFPTAGLLPYSSILPLTGLSSGYGFKLALSPAVTVQIQSTSLNPVTFKFTVRGLGGPAYNARIKASIYYVSNSSTTPSILTRYAENSTDATGSGSISFAVNAGLNNYALVANAVVGGVVGTGFMSNLQSSLSLVNPAISNYLNGNILLYHSCLLGLSSVCTSLQYNATFLVPTQNSTMRPVVPVNSTGTIGIVSPAGLQLPTTSPGLLLVSFAATGSTHFAGIVAMPWGINSLGLPLNFGGTPSSKQAVGVASRSVIIGYIDYMLTLTLWRAP